MATNKVPELITDMRMYLDGADDLIGVKTLELPKFESATEDITGIGVAGTISAPVLGHFNSMECTLEWQEPTSLIGSIRLLFCNTGRKLMHRLRRAL